MAHKKRNKAFRADVEARRAARNTLGFPPAGKIIVDKRRKPARHKKQIIDAELS